MPAVSTSKNPPLVSIDDLKEAVPISKKEGPGMWALIWEQYLSGKAFSDSNRQTQFLLEINKKEVLFTTFIRGVFLHSDEGFGMGRSLVLITQYYTLQDEERGWAKSNSGWFKVTYNPTKRTGKVRKLNEEEEKFAGILSV